MVVGEEGVCERVDGVDDHLRQPVLDAHLGSLAVLFREVLHLNTHTHTQKKMKTKSLIMLRYEVEDFVEKGDQPGLHWLSCHASDLVVGIRPVFLACAPTFGKAD